ncbi:MAG TPA: hypothetical protein PKW75_00590 [candidate division Zixibacteria bacterium]|nr:hypothetical protein [candidate division Zixibacteria bacterium]MDD4917559.1 hypothetical protein [candidate division Zixibacteria bacterium]MDM7972172.1 hypothetical protein [candidate division Zixibacteria bacterium]HOD66468.1 hypothetical protein [candidate division Zixibacteria bacterium]HOZ06758.1 hypothetical protein [candidate division Zixibacteria bacterium]
MAALYGERRRVAKRFAPGERRRGCPSKITAAPGVFVKKVTTRWAVRYFFTWPVRSPRLVITDKFAGIGDSAVTDRKADIPDEAVNLFVRLGGGGKTTKPLACGISTPPLRRRPQERPQTGRETRKAKINCQGVSQHEQTEEVSWVV